MVSAAERERWRPEDQRPEGPSEELIWQPDHMYEPLRLELPGLFASALDD